MAEPGELPAPGPRYRKSRKQFRVPLISDVAQVSGPVPGQHARLARSPRPAPAMLEGRTRRGKLLGTGLTAADRLIPRRWARSHWPAPFPGRSSRGILWHTGETGAPPLIPPWRHAQSPAVGTSSASYSVPELFKGKALRGKLTGLGQSEPLPPAQPARFADSQRPPPSALTGRVIRGKLFHTGETPTVSAPTRFTLYASPSVSFRLPARRDVTFGFLANEAMSIPSNFSFFRGEDVTLDFQMSPVEDVTGWSLSLKVADSLGGSVQFTKTPSILDGPRGRFRATIASADTASLTAGRYTWDVRRVDGGSKATLAHGEIDLKREVTA